MDFCTQRLFHSVLTCLLKCTNDWYLSFDKRFFSGVTIINLKKAFDTVDHDTLIAKLRFYGVEGVELDWFISYLSNRKQCCKVNGDVSEIPDIKCGVPQGSWLGPLIFLSISMTCRLPHKELRSQCMLMDTSIPYSSKCRYITCAMLSTQIFRILVYGFREINCLLMLQKHRTLSLVPGLTSEDYILQ